MLPSREVWTLMENKIEIHSLLQQNRSFSSLRGPDLLFGNDYPAWKEQTWNVQCIRGDESGAA